MRKRKNGPSFTFLFYSDLSGLNDAPPTVVRKVYVSLLIQMPVSSRNDLTDTPRNSASPSLSPGKLPHEINHPKILMPVRILKTNHFMWDAYYQCHFFFIFHFAKNFWNYVRIVAFGGYISNDQMNQIKFNMMWF